MKLRRYLCGMLVSLFMVTGCQTVSKTRDLSHLGEVKRVNVLNQHGRVIGKVKLTQGTDGVLIEVKVKHLREGKHGMHFHQVGRCADHAVFKQAKGHIGHETPHGFLHPEGPHAGNLPNLIVRKDGSAWVEMYSNLVSLYGGNGRPALLDDDGSALLIHKREDDHQTQPIGNSGSRVACGVIRE